MSLVILKESFRCHSSKAVPLKGDLPRFLRVVEDVAVEMVEVKGGDDVTLNLEQ